MKISFDFDDCLAIPRRTSGDSLVWAGNNYVIDLNEKISKVMSEHIAKGDNVHIVSFRKLVGKLEMIHFIRDHDLMVPIDHIHCTHHNPKSEIINELGIEIHYDDMIQVCIDLNLHSKCKPILVLPVGDVGRNSSADLFEQFVY